MTIYFRQILSILKGPNSQFYRTEHKEFIAEGYRGHECIIEWAIKMIQEVIKVKGNETE